jgi:hypothetical protein
VPSIKNLLRRCLDRDVKNRLQWIGEARIAIQKYLANPTSAPDVTQPALSRSRVGWVVLGFENRKGIPDVVQTKYGVAMRRRWV